MYQPKGRIALKELYKIIPFNEIMEELSSDKKLKHLLVLNSDNLAVKKHYLNLNRDLSGEMRKVATSVYIELCQNDNLITK